MATRSKFRPGLFLVPMGIMAAVALAALSYVATRATITAGPLFAAPGTQASGDAFTVEWRNGSDIAIIASFTPSRTIRVRSITLEGLDPKDAFIEAAQYGFWDGRSPLPTLTTTADVFPAEFRARALTGAFTAPAHSQVFVRLLVRAISDAKGNEVLNGFRIDAESWGWPHSTLIPFKQPVKLLRPR